MIEYISKEVARRIIDSGRTKWQMLAVLDSAVPADVRENKRGEWAKICWKAFRCSECKKISEYYTDFCPNCGADMRGTNTASDTKGGWDGEYYLEDC